jgi:hypothetical protein
MIAPPSTEEQIVIRATRKAVVTSTAHDPIGITSSRKVILPAASEHAIWLEPTDDVVGAHRHRGERLR